jgi:hypothetical protein
VDVGRNLHGDRFEVDDIPVELNELEATIESRLNTFGMDFQAIVFFIEIDAVNPDSAEAVVAKLARNRNVEFIIFEQDFKTSLGFEGRSFR